jgi:hypothetical protein
MRNDARKRHPYLRLALGALALAATVTGGVYTGIHAAHASHTTPTSVVRATDPGDNTEWP